MQIRLGTRQDEPIIKTIVSQALSEYKMPAGSDTDLTDIDQQYFWHDGIFVVAEDEGRIIGLAGARRAENEDTLEILRLYVIPARRKRGIGKALINTIVYFAGNSQYKYVIAFPEQQGLEPEKSMLGFTPDPNKLGRWLCSLSTGNAGR